MTSYSELLDIMIELRKFWLPIDQWQDRTDISFVLVYGRIDPNNSPYRAIYEARWKPETGKFVIPLRALDEIELHDVTHWMPLPIAPGEKNGEQRGPGTV